MDLNTFLSNPGSSVELARAISVAPSLVSQWKTGFRQVPADRCPAIERATDGAVRCEDLRPDVDWAYLRGSAPPEPPTSQSAPPSPECGSIDPRHGERRHPEKRQRLERRKEGA